MPKANAIQNLLPSFPIASKPYNDLILKVKASLSTHSSATATLADSVLTLRAPPHSYRMQEVGPNVSKGLLAAQKMLEYQRLKTYSATGKLISEP